MQDQKTSSPFMPMDGLANLPKAIHGENLRSYISRWVNLQSLDHKQRRAVRTALLSHFRESGMDVEASAMECVTAINMHRAGLGQ